MSITWASRAEPGDVQCLLLAVRFNGMSLMSGTVRPYSNVCKLLQASAVLLQYLCDSGCFSISCTCFFKFIIITIRDRGVTLRLGGGGGGHR